MVRMVCLLFIISTGSILGQSTTQSVLNLQAQDASMAPVPNAVVHIRSDSGGEKEFRTDRLGSATIALDPGQYLIYVTALGFQSWKSSVEMERNANRSIRAELKVGSICSPCVTVADDPQIEFEHPMLNIELNFLRLESLPLPSHKLRHSLPHHRAA